MGINRSWLVILRSSVHSARNVLLVAKMYNTMRCRYNAVNKPAKGFHKVLIAGPSERGMGCLLWVKTLVNVLQYATSFYVSISFHITDGQKIVMCEHEFRELGQAATIECSAGSSIDLTYVNYGRTAPYAEVCNYGYGEDRSTCGPVDGITQRARDSCQGQSTCQLTYNGLGLWDTCYSTYKYFEVKYTCIPAGTTGKALTLVQIIF